MFQLEWWREHKAKEDLELMQLKKILFKPRGSKVGQMDSAQSAPSLGGGQGLIYNEAAVDVRDVGAGAFDRFDSPVHNKKNVDKQQHYIRRKSSVPSNPILESKSSTPNQTLKIPNSKRGAGKTDSDTLEKNKDEKHKKRGNSNERGYHSGCSVDSGEISSGRSKVSGKKKKKKKRKSRSKSKVRPEENNVMENIAHNIQENEVKDLKQTKVSSRCEGCLMENCGKPLEERGGSPIDFSFIFKDDKPVITETIDDEVIENPVEPIRIEERVRTKKKKQKKRRTKQTTSQLLKEENKNLKSEDLDYKMETKITKKEKGKGKSTKSRTKKAKAPIPVRDMSKYQAKENLLDLGLKESDSGIHRVSFFVLIFLFYLIVDTEEEEQTDDYYILEADISSGGGYINFMSVSVPVDILEPEVIQRRNSNVAPISPR